MNKDNYQVKKGLNKEIIKEISKAKHEAKEMYDIRIKAYESFLKQENPKWTNDIHDIDFDEFIYYSKYLDSTKNNWDDIPDKIKQTFSKLGILEAEAKFLNGVSTQFDSEVIYHKHKAELETKNIIFCSTEQAYKDHPQLFMKYFNKLVPYVDNKYAALNTAVWSGGTFIYVPPNTHLDKPLQSYFRINSQSLGQFERTLIIVDKNSSLHYIEGCTAPVYSSNNLHAAVVEIYVEENANMKYTTIQNWSDNVLNYVTKRARVKANASMTWIDGNIGSKHNIKFPACVLLGENAKGSCISIAVANENVIQDTGAKMIHLASNTKSSIISKTINHKNSKSIFRGIVDIRPQAKNSYARIECDNLLIDDNVYTETLPYESIANTSSIIEHEATISKLSDLKIDYLTSRKITEEQAKHLIILGFVDIFSKELPMEYAVELNRLLKLTA